MADCKLSIAGIGLAAALVIAGSGFARANDPAMPIAGVTSQPIGHHEFCLEYPRECGRMNHVGPVKLTPSIWAIAEAVNDEVNGRVKPRTDMEIWGIEEVWSYPRNVGDCEDYVLAKRHELVRQGVPESNLLITVVRQTNGDGHAVLTLRTDQGDFILDNLEPRILLWTDTDYQYLKRQSEIDAGRWVAVRDNHSMTVGSIR